MSILSNQKLSAFQQLLSGASKQELIWMNGYLSGLLSNGTIQQTEVEVAVAAPSVNKITIAYGTETGNSKKLAVTFAAKAKKAGITAKVVSLDQYRLNDLPKEEYFFSLISTHGEGEPPAAARKFYDHIHNNGFKLEKLKYGVLALGDTSYPLFCTAGEQVDAQLEKLGGQRIIPIQKCDVDYEHDADSWFDLLLHRLSAPPTINEVAVAAAPVVIKKSVVKKIYNGSIVTNINLNDRGSNKQTHHIEIVANDEIDYLPGDALGVVPENVAALVDPIVELLGIDRHKTYHFRHEQMTAYDLLKKKLNIFFLPERVVAKYAQLVGQDIPPTKIGLLDLIKIYPLKNNNQFGQLIEILEPIAPRLYSIASSPEAHSGEVHLTVARDRFKVNDEWKYGLCSDFLTCLPSETAIDFYIHRNSQFRLPDDDKDIIMIGPGTGVAPFRSFIAHREAIGATGKSWLFFGDQHFVTDFLYQTEWQNWLETGALTQLTVAFSRDQSQKVYVQHKMMQHGQQLYEWLASGASLYVCGAKHPMSTDVEDTLMQLIEKFGNKTIEEAAQFVEQLRDEERYLKDVY